MGGEVYSSDNPMGKDSATIDTYEVSISTDSNGDGSTTVSLDRQHREVAGFGYAAVIYSKGSGPITGDLSVEDADTNADNASQAIVHVQNCSVTSGSITVLLTRFAERTF